jgi:DNA-binding transcriptional ArsR family regulator
MRSNLAEEPEDVTRAAGAEAPAGLISANLAKALANPWRNRILMELHLRPMSPNQFAAEFGGNLSSIARHFRELKDWGFLEVAEELRGGKRRGAVEKVYRAIQRVHFDTPTWEGLPQYLRSECSAAVLEGLLLRLSQSVGSGMFDAAENRCVSWQGLAFDRQAWTAYTDRLDDALLELSDLEVEAAERLARSGAPAIPATIAFLAFRSPPEPVEAVGPRRGSSPKPSDGPPGPQFLLSPQMAKALSNPWRNRILMELCCRPMSPKQFADEVGGPELATMARYFRQLKAGGYIEVAEELRGGSRRGAVEKIYRAVPRARIDTSAWEALPAEVRREGSGAAMDDLISRIQQGFEADTFDAEVSRHLSWKAVWLDREGWAECVSRLDEIALLANELAEESEERLGIQGGEQIPTTAALMAFRSPRSSDLVP